MAADRLPAEIEIALRRLKGYVVPHPPTENDCNDACRDSEALRRAILAAMCEAKADEHAAGDDVHLCYGIPECEVVQDYRARAASIREGK